MRSAISTTMRSILHNSTKDILLRQARFFSSGAHDTVGFIGLGNMGAAMAGNLIKANKKLIVNDMSEEAVSKLCALGAVAAKSPADVASQASTIVTMLPAGPHVLQVYTGTNGILSKVQPGAMLIECSTIDPDSARKVASACEAKGSDFVDAPVSGGTIGAQNATLTFMVGGEEAAVARAKTVLDLMGQNVVHCGGAGTGQVAKICNNLVLGITMAGVSEAFQLGLQLGIDPKVLATVVNSSSGRSWSSDTYNPCPGVMEGVPSARGYSGGFACDLMAKDLGIAVSSANSVKSPLPMGSLAQQLYSLMSAGGNGHKDFSGIFEMLQRAKK